MESCNFIYYYVSMLYFLGKDAEQKSMMMTGSNQFMFAKKINLTAVAPSHNIGTDKDSWNVSMQIWKYKGVRWKYLITDYTASTLGL